MCSHCQWQRVPVQPALTSRLRLSNYNLAAAAAAAGGGSAPPLPCIHAATRLFSSSISMRKASWPCGESMTERLARGIRAAISAWSSSCGGSSGAERVWMRAWAVERGLRWGQLSHARGTRGRSRCQRRGWAAAGPSGRRGRPRRRPRPLPPQPVAVAVPGRACRAAASDGHLWMRCTGERGRGVLIVAGCGGASNTPPSHRTRRRIAAQIYRPFIERGGGGGESCFP